GPCAVPAFSRGLGSRDARDGRYRVRAGLDEEQLAGAPARHQQARDRGREEQIVEPDRSLCAGQRERRGLRDQGQREQGGGGHAPTEHAGAAMGARRPAETSPARHTSAKAPSSATASVTPPVACLTAPSKSGGKNPPSPPAAPTRPVTAPTERGKCSGTS